MADKKPSRWKDRYWRSLRQISQAIALVLFVILLLGLRRDGMPPAVANFFLQLDLLAMLTSMLASRTFLIGSLWALLTIGLTLIVGRAWCGWICPLGTLLDWFPLRKWKKAQPGIPESWRIIKHFLLLIVLFSSLMGSLTLMFLDPLTILTRGLAEGFLPALDTAITAVEKAAYGISALRPIITPIDRVLRPAIIPEWTSYPVTGVLFAGLLGLVVALNLLAPRFWCRYLCPLGSMLGLLSKVTLLRRTVKQDACNECAACALVCPTGTIRAEKHHASDPAECTMCMECIASCPRAGQSFSAHIRPASWNAYDPGRREFLASAGLAVAAVALVKADATAHTDPPHLIRPPGALRNGLSSKCVRCGDCVRGCPTGAIHPAAWEAGPDGFGSPVLFPRTGFCEFSCNQCGQICPVGAIPNLALAAKQQTVIGHAYVDKDRCLAWGDHVDCIVCEEMCPLPKKAITLEPVSFSDTSGNIRQVLAPVVDRDRCIGCGTCEYKCPVNGQAAIQVWSVGKNG